ncbi:MAG: M67 family metallopeptidase [Phototrophicales bacterium]|nr:M67 family metallopeptidase [Phototrophicales bacterium]
MAVYLPEGLQNFIFYQLQADYANEGGGFLLGKIEGDNTHIVRTITIENVFETEEQYHRYAMTPQNWAKMEDAADEQGLTLVGYYHSHPDAPAIPSVFDRDHALPNFVYIITSVQNAKAVDMTCWRLRPDRTAFDVEQLVIQA